MEDLLKKIVEGYLLFHEPHMDAKELRRRTDEILGAERVGKCSSCDQLAFIAYRVLTNEQGPLQHWVYRCLEHQFTIERYKEGDLPREPIELTVNNDNEDWIR